MLYVVTRSVEHGRVAGLCSVAGIEAGALVHVIAASAGLAALLERSPGALTAVRWIGAGYLLWLAVRQLRRPQQWDDGSPVAPSRVQLFRDGVIIDLLNPRRHSSSSPSCRSSSTPRGARRPSRSRYSGCASSPSPFVCDGVYAVGAGGFATRVQASARASEVVRLGAALIYLSMAGAAVTL